MGQNLEYFILQPAKFKLDGGGMYGIIPKPLWNKVHPADELNRVELALRLLLIKSREKVVLIDTGIGDYHDKKFISMFDLRSEDSPLEQALKEINLTSNDITDLVISHFHFDHIGGLGIKEGESWKAALPNARLHIHKEHYEYAHNPTARDAGSFHAHCFDPVIEIYREKGLLHFYEGPEGELFDLGDSSPLKFRCSHGHTPWLMHPYTEDLIYLTDLIPTSHHIATPWVMGYDISPGVTTENKIELLKFIEEKGLDVVYEHDPEYWGSRLGRDEKGRLKALENFAAQDKIAFGLRTSS